MCRTLGFRQWLLDSCSGEPALTEAGCETGWRYQVDAVFSHTECLPTVMMWLRVAVVWRCPPSLCSFHFPTLIGTYFRIAVQHRTSLYSSHCTQLTASDTLHKNQLNSLQSMSDWRQLCPDAQLHYTLCTW